MALHTGTAEEWDGDYFGPPVNRVARLLSAGHGGQTLLSLSTYELVRDHLPTGVELRDMGERRLKDLIRPERVFQVVAADLPSEFPPLKTLDARPNNLPAQPNPLIGREREVAAVSAMLRESKVRLVTLTGPGGTGKTRLALQTAAEMVDEFEDGAIFVNLAPITDQGLVVSTIAQALDVKEVAGEALLETLKANLKERQMLLVLDNFEQVLGAAPVVSELLTAASQLKVLATSREGLRVRAERTFPVPPLELPDPKRLPPLERLTQYEGVRLFIDRAVAAKPDFKVTNENAPAVAEICYRLDGLPLAIELAAARIRILPPHSMLARLESRLKLLTGGSRDLPARQQTLRAAIEWSYDLLDEEEKKLLRRLAVFVGGCTLEAIEAVCNAGGDLEVEVLDGVESLVSKSLLRQEEGVGGEPRFVMLETIHEYTRGKLEESGEAVELRQNHAAYFTALAEESQVYTRGPQSVAWLDRLEVEHDNFRAALQWFERSDQREQGDLGLRLAGALERFWRRRSHAVEGQAYIQRFLKMPGSRTPTLSRAKALNVVGNLTSYLGDTALARSYQEESVAAFRGLDDTFAGKEGLAAALQGLGWELADVDPLLGNANLQESLALWRKLGDPYKLSAGLNTMSLALIEQGDYEAARMLSEENLSIRRGFKDHEGIAQSLNTLGEAARGLNNFSVALRYYAESLEIWRLYGDKQAMARMHHNLGYAALGAGDLGKAKQYFAECIARSKEAAYNVGVIGSLAGLAAVAAVVGKTFKAARLSGAFERLAARAKVELDNIDKIAYRTAIVTARARLDETTWEQARAEGQEMSLNQAIEYALENGEE
jgi:predicted ATPase